MKMFHTPSAVSSEQAVAMINAVEDETFERVAKSIRGYISRKSKKNNGSRIAAAKVIAAQDVLALIYSIPRKSKEASRHARD